jgi:hypothetical protein
MRNVGVKRKRRGRAGCEDLIGSFQPDSRAEIHKFEMTLLRYHNVVWSKISVNDPKSREREREREERRESDGVSNEVRKETEGRERGRRRGRRRKTKELTYEETRLQEPILQR